MEPTVGQLLHKGVAAQKAGALREAENCYRKVLKLIPNQPDANHNLGVLAASMNQFAVALPLFKIAVDSNPNVEQFWFSYLNALIHENRIDTAKKVIKKAKKQRVSKEKLGEFTKRLSQPHSNQSVNKNVPPENQLNALLQSFRSHRLAEAERLALRITREFPDEPIAWKILGAILGKTGRLSEALAAHQKTVQLTPDDPETHSNIGFTFQELDRFEDAEACYRKAIELQPGFAQAHSKLGFTLQKQHRFIEAEESCKKAINLKPDLTAAYYNLGLVSQKLGKFEQAEESYNKALQLNPKSAEVHRSLSYIKTFTDKDRQYLQMESLLKESDGSEEQDCNLNFGLAKASEDLGDLKSAYNYYRDGNRLRKSILKYDVKREEHLFEQLKASYPEISRHRIEHGGDANSLTPIFIVGMPRSGTSLVEQIISSHSEVTGAGELDFMAQFGGDIARGTGKVSSTTLHKVRTSYLEKLKYLSEANQVVTDKMPLNFRFLGLIAAIFPEAKIVHVKREAAAICWGNYKQFFSSKSLGFTYDLKDIIEYYSLYENLMGFWQSQLSANIYHLDYDLLTTNQEVETKALMNYLGLRWDEACLAPEENRRAVATLSNIQVRDKVYKGSSQQWKKFEPFLNGILDDISQN